MKKRTIISICLIILILVIIIIILITGDKNNKNKDELSNISKRNLINNENIKTGIYGNYVIVDENNNVIRDNVPEEMLDVYKIIPDFDPNPIY